MITQLKKYSILICVLFIISCTSNCTKLSNNEIVTSKKISTEQTTNETTKKTIVNYGESDIVTSSVLDKNGNLWFGTTDEGVYKYDGKTFTNFSETDGLCDNEVWSMIEDTDGNLWFGTGKGLCKYDGKTFTNIPIPWDGSNDIWGEMCNPNIVTSLIQDKKGDLWVGTCGGGAYRYDGEKLTIFLIENDQKQSDSLHHNLIKSIVEDDDGNIWFTSLTHGGVSRYDGNELTHFSTKDGLFDDMVFCSTKDKNGNLWFGAIQTIDGGLYRYDLSAEKEGGKSFTNFNKIDGLCDNFIFSLFEDKNENLWIGTGKGLCLYDGKTFVSMFPEESQRMGDIRTFVEDKNGNLWFGGRYGGLWRYDGKTLTDFTQKNN